MPPKRVRNQFLSRYTSAGTISRIDCSGHIMPNTGRHQSDGFADPIGYI